MKNKRDRLFFTQLFVSQRKQIDFIAELNGENNERD